MIFEKETEYTPPEGAEVVELDPFKAVFMIPKKQCGSILAGIMQNFSTQDISVEEEDIGTVVERIYTLGGDNE